MATSFDTNIGIQSVLGFKRPSGSDPATGYYFQAPRPVMQTTKTLNGEEFADTGINTATRVLIVDPLSTFEITQGNTSSNQTVVLRNFGNAMITVTNVAFSFNGAIPIPTFSPATLSTGKIEIAPDSSATFQLAYYSVNPGTHANTFLLTSNIDTTYTRVWSYQEVTKRYSLSASPLNITSTSTQYGERVRHTYYITPVVNLVPVPGLDTFFTATVSSSTPGWGIHRLEKNQETGIYEVEAEFKTLTVASSTGTYLANVIVQSEYQGITAYYTATSIVNIDVDFTEFQNLGTWVSPAATYNSVIGISYDRIGVSRYLTIGVGTGGDGTQQYAYGGQSFTATSSLGFLGTVTDYSYGGWATVYRFPIDHQSGIPVRYLSSATTVEGAPLYKEKTTAGLDYETSFGLEGSVGSMFIVDSDGAGNVEISMNQLRSVTDNEETNTTLRNLTRAFYYYSNIDEGQRYYNISGTTILDGTVTELFQGFDSAGRVITSIVDVPRRF